MLRCGISGVYTVQIQTIRILEIGGKKKQAGLGESLSNEGFHAVESVDGGRDDKSLPRVWINHKSRLAGSLDRFDLGPRNLTFLITESIRVDAYRITLLHPPADHSEDLNDQKSGREDKVQEILPDEIEDQGDKEKQE